MDNNRLKFLAGITEHHEIESAKITKQYKIERLREMVDFVRHVKSYGASITVDHITNYADITINESTKQESEHLYNKIINEWNYGADQINEKDDSTLWALYIKGPDDKKFGLQFTDSERSVVMDEWRDSWKECYDDDGKRIKYSFKIVKGSDNKKLPDQLDESLNEGYESLADVTKAVDDNKKVVWKTSDYVVHKDLFGDYLITYRPWSRNPNSVGLFHLDGVTSDYNPEDFWIDEKEVKEAVTVLPSIDTDRYQEREGLEGPFRWRNGRVVYYDPKEGKYYDPNTDFYIEYDEYVRANNPQVRESVETKKTTKGGMSDLGKGQSKNKRIEILKNHIASHKEQLRTLPKEHNTRKDHEKAIERWQTELNSLLSEGHVGIGVINEEHFETVELTLPDFWAPVLFNADRSTGLSDDDENALNAWIEWASKEYNIRAGQPIGVSDEIEEFSQHHDAIKFVDPCSTRIYTYRVEEGVQEHTELHEDHGSGYYVCYDDKKDHYEKEVDATAAKIKLEKSGVKNVKIVKDVDDGTNSSNDLKEENSINVQKLQDSDKNTKIKIPQEVKTEANKQIADIKKSIDEFSDGIKPASTNTDVRINAIEAIETLLDILDGGTLEDLKKAQVYYGTLMNPITVLLPNLLVKFLVEPKHFIKL